MKLDLLDYFKLRKINDKEYILKQIRVKKQLPYKIQIIN